MSNILSLFDGISCARVALERAGVQVGAYYASEVDKYAIQISQKNYPDIVQVGSVTELYPTPNLHNVDLLIGGSPCQDLSIAKSNRKGLDGERSGLFWEYVRILREAKPRYFILENVASMSKESRDKISEVLGVQPVMINASLVSAQNRKRLFWVGKLVDDTYTQVEIPQPEDRGILLKDILEENVDEKYEVLATQLNMSKQFGNSVSDKGKAFTLRASNPNGIIFCKIQDKVKVRKYPNDTYKIRKLTPIECERLQGLPDNYTDGVSNSQRYKMLGNAFNVDVVAHIIKHLSL